MQRRGVLIGEDALIRTNALIAVPIVRLLGSVNIYLSLFFSRCNIVPFKNSTPSLILQFLNTKSSNIQDKL